MSVRRSARFPCGDCAKSCASSNCISCGMCSRWFHIRCEKISNIDFKLWSSLEMDYLCRSCRSVSGDGFDFDYMMGMQRLTKPPFADPEKGKLTLMWTTMRVPSKPPTASAPWKANHIVPLVDGVARGPVISMTEFNRQKKQCSKRYTTNPRIPISNRFEKLKEEVIEKNEDSNGLNTFKEESEKTKPNKISDISLESSEVCTPLEHDCESPSCSDSELLSQFDSDSSTHIDSEPPYYSDSESLSNSEPYSVGRSPSNNSNSTDFILPDIPSISEENEGNSAMRNMDTDNCESDQETDDDQNVQITPGPLRNKFMDIGDTIKLLSGPYTILPEIPTGHKDGMFYVVDNSKNNERRNAGKKSEFWDDRGSWTNGASPTYTFIAKGEKLVTVQKRGGLYCTERMINREKVYDPINPQPSENELLIVKRLFNTLAASEKGPNQFKRRCSWIVNTPVSMPEIPLNVSVIEYIGTFPDRKPHASVKSNNAPMYIRTKPEVHRELKERLKYQSVKTVEKKLLTKKQVMISANREMKNNLET